MNVPQECNLEIYGKLHPSESEQGLPLCSIETMYSLEALHLRHETKKNIDMPPFDVFLYYYSSTQTQFAILSDFLSTFYTGEKEVCYRKCGNVTLSDAIAFDMEDEGRCFFLTGKELLIWTVSHVIMLQGQYQVYVHNTTSNS